MVCVVVQLNQLRSYEQYGYGRQPQYVWEEEIRSAVHPRGPSINHTGLLQCVFVYVLISLCTYIRMYILAYVFDCVSVCRRM